MNNQQIVFPEINREEMEKGVLPKEQAIAFVEKAIDSLILIAMLKVTGFPSRENENKAREVEETLGNLTNKYRQIIWVRQNILGKKIQDMIQGPGDSSRLSSKV